MLPHHIQFIARDGRTASRSSARIGRTLRRPEAPDKIPGISDQQNCETEIALANQIFGKFWNKKVAVAILPLEDREKVGPVEKWRWCFLNIRCCMIFGWLLCHGPRGIRGYSYYLKRYWQGVREVLGRPVSNPPTVKTADGRLNPGEQEGVG